MTKKNQLLNQFIRDQDHRLNTQENNNINSK